jgi:glucose/mannose-6-phosphate isomerase
MTVDAQERLDTGALLAAADPADMLRQVASSAAQVRAAVRATQEADLTEIIAAGRPRAIVVTGMGGSGVAGDVLAAVCGRGCPVQILPVHDYQLPAWVGAADLVIAVSCSGGTEETIAAAAEAVRRGCRLIGVGGDGSQLAMIAQQARAPFIGVVSAGMPRSTLWGLSMPLVVIAGRLGLLEAGAEEYESAAAELERISHLCRPDSESFVNPAKSLALDLAGTLPMIWGTSPLAGVAAYRFACQLNENAKYPAVIGTLPRPTTTRSSRSTGRSRPAWPGSARMGWRCRCGSCCCGTVMNIRRWHAAGRSRPGWRPSETSCHGAGCRRWRTAGAPGQPGPAD